MDPSRWQDVHTGTIVLEPKWVFYIFALLSEECLILRYLVWIYLSWSKWKVASAMERLWHNFFRDASDLSDPLYLPDTDEDTLIPPFLGAQAQPKGGGTPAKKARTKASTLGGRSRGFTAGWMTGFYGCNVRIRIRHYMTPEQKKTNELAKSGRPNFMSSILYSTPYMITHTLYRAVLYTIW
jgi:hypothetical protein